MFPTSVILRTANRKALTVLGIVPVQVETISADRETRVKVNTMLYVVEELKCTFISNAILEDQGSIQKYFPRPSPRRDYARVASVRGTATDTVGEEKCIPATGMAGEKADCGYLLRTSTPDPPALPYQATEENRKRLEELKLNYYRSFTFNTCQHQPLPLMHGEPLKFHVQEDAVPTAIHVPPSIPVYC